MKKEKLWLAQRWALIRPPGPRSLQQPSPTAPQHQQRTVQLLSRATKPQLCILSIFLPCLKVSAQAVPSTRITLYPLHHPCPAQISFLRKACLLLLGYIRAPYSSLSNTASYLQSWMLGSRLLGAVGEVWRGPVTTANSCWTLSWPHPGQSGWALLHFFQSPLSHSPG